LITAQELERSRIARELHDDISQPLALLAIELELLARAPRTRARLIAGEAIECVQSLSEVVRNLSRRLHPATLRLVGLVAAVKSLQAQMSQSGISITFSHDHVPPGLSPDVALCLFRIVEEGLQNAIRHSQARKVCVELTVLPAAFRLTITDDGIGFDVTSAWARGLGLSSMVERVEAIGGALDIESKPGVGTSLMIFVPIEVAAAASIASRDL
jgi:signal transduction histidine kinase